MLIAVIFIAFISLGIPDSLLGAAWPAVYEDLALPTGYISLISAVITSGTVLSSFAGGVVIRRLGTVRTVVMSTALTAAALFGFSVSGSILLFCILALPLGLGAGAIDTALNSFVVFRFKPSVLNYLHCFYGVGVFTGPILISRILRGSGGWRGGYFVMACVQGTIALLLFLSAPLWRKKEAESGADNECGNNAEYIGLISALRLTSAKPAFAVFLTANALEACCTVWGGTVLVSEGNADPAGAAGIVALYFAGLTAGRFVSGIIAEKITPMRITFLTLLLFAAGIIMLLFSQYMTAFVLLGFGIGPLHPNMLRMTPEIFGEKYSQSMMGYEIGFAYIAVLLTPIVFGFICRINSGLFPWFLMLLLAGLTCSCAVIFHSKKSIDNIKRM